MKRIMKFPRHKSIRPLGLLLLLLAAAAGCQPADPRASQLAPKQVVPASTLSDAQRSFRQARYAEALQIAQTLLVAEPGAVPLRMLAGESATKLQRYTEALQHYRQVPDAAGAQAAVARWAAGEIYFHLGQATNSIEQLQASLKINPELIEARERLAWILGVCGRRGEMQPHLLALVRADRMSLETLLDLGNPWTEFQDWTEIQRYRDATPSDLLPNLVFARKHQQNGEAVAAESLLVDLLNQQPQLLAAHAQLGHLWRAVHPEKLAAWNARLPQSADTNADIWCVRGLWLRESGDVRGSVHCLLQALSRDPNHPLVCAELAKSLSQIKETAAIEALEMRSTELQALHQTVDRIRRTRNYEPTIRQAAELTNKLGRYWESIAWCQYALRLNAQATWHRKLLEEIGKRGVLGAAMPQTVVSPDLKLLSNAFERFPAPKFPQADLENVPPPPSVAASSLTPAVSDERSAVRFVDIASRAGIDFVYQNSFVDRSLGKRMFEFTGAGVGVLDYDHDGRPDLFLAQGTPWPVPANVLVPSDRLYRNLGSRDDQLTDFAEVTQAAGIADRQFGQGVCVADIDSDGFDDVYVANVGGNQLWLNQGDGTFRDGNLLFSESSDLWTVSALAADLNGDGLTEIYDVNYVTGTDVYTQRCAIGGKPRACPPLVFTPAPQNIWVPSSQGHFELYDGSPPRPLSCNGLGALAFLPLGETLPSIFVAVDQQANLLLRFQRDDTARHGFAIDDEAILAGIAFDQAGLAQACMGVAAGDVDQNGEVDLLVTNFYDESNTLYLQDAGQFSDATLKTGLVGPSRPMLGFGAQMLDVDLDGDLDLAVLNGHIDDHSHMGIVEKMRPQMFLNTGSTQFVELPTSSAGDFFALPGLGRGMATLDLNSDGRLDLVCTDLESPLALLENQTPQLGEYLAVFLVGVQSDRNAFFTQVTAAADDFKSTQQLVAGSGYIASNQRMLLFAVPSGTAMVDLSIQWPSGHSQRIANVAVNRSITVIEGLTK